MNSEDIILPAIILPSKVLKAHLAELQEAEVKKHPFRQEIVLREFSPDGGVTDW